MPEEKTITETILDRLSQLSAESAQKIKFGSGAVGKIALAAVFAFVAIGAAAVKSGGVGVIAIVVGAIVLIFFAMLAAILYIVQKQPEVAVLEGMELVRYKQVTAIGAKGFTPERELPPVPDPKFPQLEEGTQA